MSWSGRNKSSSVKSWWPERRTSAPRRCAQDRRCQAKANELLAQIRKGASFEDIAKKNSDGPTAAQGGDLGYFKRGTLAKELEDKTFAMKPGDVTDVIRTKQGFVILKVAEHQPAGIPPERNRAPMQDAIFMRKMQPALRAYLQKLREDAFIDIKPAILIPAPAPTRPSRWNQTTKDRATAKKLKEERRRSSASSSLSFERF